MIKSNDYFKVLDATFDDVLPLAISRMPRPLESLVRATVRDHLNLNVAEQLVRSILNVLFSFSKFLLIAFNPVLFYRYHGPVLLIRRTDDEMVCVVTENTENSLADTSDQNNVAWNRGNHLLAKLLTRRYPYVLRGSPEISLLRKFLSVATPHARRKYQFTRCPIIVIQQFYFKYEFFYTGSILEQTGVDDEECISMIKKSLSNNVVKYPSNLGEDYELSDRLKLTLFLVSNSKKIL